MSKVDTMSQMQHLSTPDALPITRSIGSTCSSVTSSLADVSEKTSLINGVEITWTNLTLKIKENSETKTILEDVNGIARPGELLAIMGPSGSGKTSLLNVLAGRNTKLELGTVMLNSNPLNKQLRRKISYVLQEDIFFEHLTLKDTLTFAAKVRLPSSMSLADKKKKVEQIVDILDLRKCLNTKIGGAGTSGGLSGGEKKRANIACELLIDPDVLLLDEPTSGLDSSIAYSLMRNLKDFAKSANKTVVTTIHQPSSQIFFMFDYLMLLHEGQLIYYGTADNVVEYFSKMNMICPDHFNPSDFIMEKIKGTEDEIKTIKLEASKSIWNKISPRRKSLVRRKSLPLAIKLAVNSVNGTASSDSVEIQMTGMNEEVEENGGDFDLNRKWPTGFWEQYLALTVRNFKQSRDVLLSKLQYIETLSVAIICGLFWFQLPYLEHMIFERISLVFFASVYIVFYTCFSALISFPGEKTVINKERSSGYYRLSAYYLAKLTSELPLILFLPTFFYIITFWMVGLGGPVEFFCVWFLFLIISLLGQSTGLFIGAACMDFSRSMTVAAIYILSMMLLGGFYVEELPFWLDWCKYTSFVLYPYHAVLQIIFNPSSKSFLCNVENSQFDECLIQNATLSLNATETEINLYISPQSVLEHNRVELPLWINLMVTIAFIIAFRITTYIILRIRKPD